MRQKAQSVRRTVQNLRDGSRGKWPSKTKEPLTAARDRERLRQMGDLVTANLHLISKGQTVLTAENFYDPELRPIQIALSPRLSPQRMRQNTIKITPKPKTRRKS